MKTVPRLGSSARRRRNWPRKTGFVFFEFFSPLLAVTGLTEGETGTTKWYWRRRILHWRRKILRQCDWPPKVTGYFCRFLARMRQHHFPGRSSGHHFLGCTSQHHFLAPASLTSSKVLRQPCVPAGSLPALRPTMYFGALRPLIITPSTV